MKYYILSAFILFLCACSSTAHQKTADHKSIAIEKYGKNVRFLYNTSETAVVCIHADKASVLNPTPSLNFFIFDLKKNKTLHEAEIPGGSLQWIDDHRVEIKSKPEVITRKEESMPRSYIIDIRSTD